MAGPERLAEIMKRKAAREARQAKRPPAAEVKEAGADVEWDLTCNWTNQHVSDTQACNEAAAEIDMFIAHLRETRPIGEAPAIDAASLTATTPDKETDTMSNAAAITIYGVAKTKFDRIIKSLQSTQQKAADATTENASEWKGAKDAGVNNKALKLCLSLDRMADDKRADFLKAFDAYRNDYFIWWNNQPDMFEQPAARAAAEQDDDGLDEGEEELPLAADDGDETGATRGEVEDVADGPGADWAADPVNMAEDAQFDGYGFAFNDGKHAGIAGVGPEANPHDAGSIQADAWEKGRVSAAPLVEEVNHYNAGWAAHKAGETRDANPCEAETKAAADWAQGWNDREKKQDKGAKRAVKAATSAEPETVADIADMPAGVVVPFDGGAASTAAVH